jgi:hypothetical protein
LDVFFDSDCAASVVFVFFFGGMNILVCFNIIECMEKVKRT